MPRITTCFLFLLSVYFLNAQSFYVYKNDFDETLINEKTVKNADHIIELRDGLLLCEQLKVGYYWCIAERIYIDPEQDYELEIKMRPYNYEKLTAECGLVFGLKDINLFNCFTVNSFGVTSIKEVNSLFTNTIAGAKRVHNYTFGDWFTLKVIRKGGVNSFYFNDELIAQPKSITFHGRWLGWYTNGKMGVQLDYFYVRQNRGEVQIAPESKLYFKERIKTGINTGKDEVAPFITPDGSRIIYGSILNGEGNFYSDSKEGIVTFFAADLDSNLRVTSPLKWKLPLLQPWYIAGSAENKNVFVGEKNNFFTTTGSPIVGFDLTGNMQSKNTIRFASFAGVKFSHANISTDGKAMVLSGYKQYEPNGYDLYISLKDGEKWSEPKKITSLQSGGDEITPCFSADEKKIYFSSDGFPGYGFTDVFVSTRLDDSWMNWSKPKNLGKIINDAGFNEYFNPPDSITRRIGVMSSTFGNVNNLDVYLVKGKFNQATPKSLLKLNLTYSDSTTPYIKQIEIASNKIANPQIYTVPESQIIQLEMLADEIFTFRVPDTSYMILRQSFFANGKNEKIIIYCKLYYRFSCGKCSKCCASLG